MNRQRLRAANCSPLREASRVSSRDPSRAEDHLCHRRLAGETRAFTLVEIIVVIAIVTLLLGILLPALSSVRESARSLVCASNLRTVTTQFVFFAEGHAESGRGNSESLGTHRFRINDFQESLYRIDEFWDMPGQETSAVSGEAGVMLCPSLGAPITKRRGFPCGQAALGPVEDISIGLNMRLYRPAVAFKGNRVLAPATTAYVRTDIVDHSFVPLVIDVDGREALNRGLDPFYMAPPLPDVDEPYSDGRYWMPGSRHSRKVNVGFVGGHVLTSSNPESEEAWDWTYQASTGR